MRLTANERRLMHRRLRHILPEAFRKRKKRWEAARQMALVVAATITLSPAAWAKVEAGEARPVLASGVTFDQQGNATVEATKDSKSEQFFTKKYTKEELEAKLPPNPSEELGSRIMGEITGLLSLMTTNQAGGAQQSKSASLQSKEPTKDQYLLSVAAIKDAPTRKSADGEQIRLYLGSEMQRAASTKIKSKINILSAFNSGMNFNLKMDELFAPAEESQPAGELRYGLVLEEITPNSKVPGSAAISDMAEEMQYAGHADVKWTIGPVSEAGNRKLFKIKELNSADQEGEKSSFWSRIRTPKAAFTGNIAPRNFDNLAKVDKTNMPQWAVQAGQAEGYYTMTYSMKTSGERLSEEHQVRLPIIGDSAIGRRFNDKFAVVETSAYNILYDKRLPLVSIHYMNIEQRYKAEMSTAFGEKHTKSLTIGAVGLATGKVATEAERKETYRLTYGESF